MTEILIISIMLVFSLFLVLGSVTHSGVKWLYFTLSILTLCGAFFMVAFYAWNLAGPSKSPPPKAIQTEIQQTPAKGPPADDLQQTTPQSKPPTNVVPDTKITVPDTGSVSYKVVKEDTLWSIASRAGVTVEKIKQWNGLTSDVIQVNQVIKLYGKNAEPKPTVTSSPSVLIEHGSLQKKQIALTFDAGSDDAGIGILDVLKKYNVKATFFLTGKWVDKFPNDAKRIAAEGYEIGNHSYSHPDAVTITANALIQDIKKAEQEIKTVTGTSPLPYFRFPYGSYNANALKTVGEAGYAESIQWSLDTLDWQQPSTEVIVSRIEQGASNGDIILMHIGGKNTPEAVDKVIPFLKAEGYQLVTVSELLK